MADTERRDYPSTRRDGPRPRYQLPGRAGVSPAAELLGRYPVVSQLGAGGMGEVLEVSDNDLGRGIAVKVLPLSAGRDALDKFVQEARIAGQLEHPNIVPIYELGATADAVYFTMKRVEGQDLAELLEDRDLAHPRKRAELLRIFVKLCDAVAFAHSRGVVHRDLKPANVMVGRFGEVLVMDWGVAKVCGRADETERSVVGAPPGASVTETLDGTVVGTPAYMSPEQAEGRIEDVDARSDVYAMGALLYRLLTNALAYDGRTAETVIEEVAVGDVVPPSTRRPDLRIPWELEAVVLKAMALRPDDRYQTATELQRDVQRYLDGHTLGAAEYNALQRLAKWVGRHKALTAMGAVCLALLIGAAALRSWRDDQARQAAVATALTEAAALVEGRPDVDALRASLAARAKADRPASRRRVARARQTLAAYLKAASRLERGLILSPGDPRLTARRRAVGEALGLASALSGDFTLARQAMADLELYGADATTAAARVAEVERERTRRSDRRIARLHRMLADLGEGLSSGERHFADWRLDDYLDEVLALRDEPKALPLLAGAIERLRRLGEQGGREARWSDDQRHLARVVTRALARTGSAAAVEVLSGWLAVLWDEALLVEAGLALCDTRRPEAQAPLLEAAKRIGTNSQAWRRIAPSVTRVPEPEGFPTSPTTKDLVRRAFARTIRGDLEGAVADYAWALKINPKHVTAMLNRSNVLMQLGRADDALADLNRAIAVEPDRAALYSNRAGLRMNRGDKAGALADYDRAIRLQPTSGVLHTNRGAAKERIGDARGALADYNRAIELEPRRIEPWMSRGALLLRARDHAGAARDLTRAIRLDPRRPVLYDLRAQARMRLGHKPAALADWSRAIELEPANARWYNNRGNARSKTGKHREALADFDRALTLTPGSSVLLHNRALAHQAAGDLDRALVDFTAALKAPGARVIYLRNRGRCHLLRGSAAEAIADLTQALRHQPRNGVWLCDRGQAHQARGDFARARADYDAALRHEPKLAYAMVHRARLRLQTGDVNGAAQDSNTARQLSPDDIDAWAVLGEALAKLKRPKDATTALRKALALARDDAQRKAVLAVAGRVGLRAEVERR